MTYARPTDVRLVDLIAMRRDVEAARVRAACMAAHPSANRHPDKSGVLIFATREQAEDHNRRVEALRTAMAPAQAAIAAQVICIGARLGWPYDAPGHGDTPVPTFDDLQRYVDEVGEAEIAPSDPRCDDQRELHRFRAGTPRCVCDAYERGSDEPWPKGTRHAETLRRVSDDPHDVPWRRSAALHGHPGTVCWYTSEDGGDPRVCRYTRDTLDNQRNVTQGTCVGPADQEAPAVSPKDTP